MKIKALLFCSALSISIACGAPTPEGLTNSTLSARPGGLDAGSTPPPLCEADGPALEAACVQGSGWGNGLSKSFGRLDGTLTAIATPGSSQCSQSNARHLVLEVTMHGAPYALVLNVNDSQSSSGVFLGETEAPLFGAPWQEGWHTGSIEKLDYARDLSVHSSAFQPYSEPDLVSTIVCELVKGDSVSIYGLGWGADGAHDIHRNTGGGGADGAVVLHANSAHPHYLLFHFVNQTF